MKLSIHPEDSWMRPSTAHRLSVVVYGLMLAGVLFRMFSKVGFVGLEGFVHTSRSMLLLGLVYLAGIAINSMRRCTEHANAFVVLVTVMSSMIALYAARAYAIRRLKTEKPKLSQKERRVVTLAMVGYAVTQIGALWVYDC